MVDPVIVSSVCSKEAFLTQVYPKRKPALLKGVDIGRATALWTPKYLCERCRGIEVKVHVCPVEQMDFIGRNFVYRTLPFEDFVRRINRPRQVECFTCPEEKYYLRSIGEDPRKTVADFPQQFPRLSEDINLPLFFEPDQLFSSVLRMGSPGVQLWTHYDVMDNFLVQVRGRKRVILYSPRDAGSLYLQGDKSQVLNVEQPDLSAFPRFAEARPYSCVMEAGDVLFIPALWFHNVKALDSGIAVNVFWKHLESQHYDQKDTYGNRDLLPAQKAFQIMDRAMKALDALPAEYRDFYGRCLVSRIESKTHLS